MTLIDKGCFERGCACYDSRDKGECVEVVKKQEWVGLTDEDIWDVFGGRIGTSNSDVNPIRLLADARKIEDKLKKKNA